MTSFDESIQDQVVASSHLSSLEKYKFLVDQVGLICVRTRDDFDGPNSPNGLSPTPKILNIGFGRMQSLKAKLRQHKIRNHTNKGLRTNQHNDRCRSDNLV